MLPPELQFELTPRRPVAWLRQAILAGCSLVVGALLLWLVPRQQELERLRLELEEGRQRLAAARQPMPPPAPPPTWQAAAAQDGRLFALQLEPRLLEIERCTGPKATVTRIVHDELSGSTTLEVTLLDATELSPMLECINRSGDKEHPWRLATVDAVPLNPGIPASQRIVFKRT